jgi:predicted house-cleaning NTP pyrophosphatase (Maf/HAM1 superfamily)
MAMPAFAQTSAQPRSTAAATPVKAPASSPKALTVAAANAKAATLTSATPVTAAGSVIILSDGIVANASMAQIEPPAPGFVYEP